MRDRRLILAIESASLNMMVEATGREMFLLPDLIELGVLPMLDAPDALRDVCNMLTDCGVWVGPRQQLEQMQQFRQLIPYIVLQQGDKFALYTRGETGGESRLHGKLAIGFGGHIDLPDLKTAAGGVIDLMETVGTSAAREMLEEVGLMTRAGEMDCMGLVISNDTEVSRVHVGLVLVMPVQGQVSSLEEDQQNIEWMTLDEIEALDPERAEGFTGAVGGELRRWLELQKPEDSSELVALPGQK